MRRKTFDLLAVIGGLVLAVVLAVAGGVLLWGHHFVSDQVRTQLAAQKISFPPAGRAPPPRPSPHPRSESSVNRTGSTCPGGRTPTVRPPGSVVPGVVRA